LTRPVAELTGLARNGTRFVVPEVQLLYEAKHHLDKDEHDFQQVLPLLSPGQRSWLRHAVELVHPGDRWLAELA
jgi:hypothetical protein